MKSIILMTSNEWKIKQAKAVLEPLGIQVETQDVDVPEIQDSDPLVIATAKAQGAYEIIGKPLVVCDHFWAIPALKGFPGGYMKDINHWFEPEDFLALMRYKKDKSLILTEAVVYIDGDHTKEFLADTPAHFVDEPRGQGMFPQEQVVAFDGQDKTIAENMDMGHAAQKREDSAWQKFGEWFAAKQ